MAEELAGCLDPVAGREAAHCAVHDVEQVADHGLAVVGARTDYVGHTVVVGKGWGGERRCQVFERLVAGAGRVARRQRGPFLAGTAVEVACALELYCVAAFHAGELGQVFRDEAGSDGVELLGCLDPVADVEALVV